jgi:tellurite resistance-related uncharacterized protein
MNTLPEDVVAYKQTRTFDTNTTPAGLLGEHSTRAGVWGRLIVLEGRLHYTIFKPIEEVHVLEAGDVGIIAPEQPHKVALEEGTRFMVEFLK